MVKLHFAPYIIELRCAHTVIRHFLLIEEAEHTLARRPRRHKAVGGLGYLGERVCKQLYIAYKRNYRSEADIPAHGERRAHDADGHIAEVADEAHKRLHEAAEKLGLPRAAVQIFVYPAELVLGLLHSAVDAHDIMSGIHLLDMSVHITEIFLLLLEILARALYDAEHEHKAKHGGTYRSESKTAARCKHYYRYADKLHHRLNKGRYAGV